MIILVQVGINKHLQITLALRARSILVDFEKNYLCFSLFKTAFEIMWLPIHITSQATQITVMHFKNFS